MENSPDISPQSSNVSQPSREEITPTNAAAYGAVNLPPFEVFHQDNGQELKHLEGELRLTLEEIARLQNALAEANMKLLAAQSTLPPSTKSASSENYLLPMVKELRQPLVTIKGYLDLLLNESVGALGAFQRRFVERIQKSVDHMEKSIDNLVNSSSEDKSDSSLYSQSFSVRKSIESALDLFITTIRSKEIVLKINIPFDDVRLFEDKEKFEQVLNLLLTNSTTALNSGGTLTINMEEYLTLQPQEIIITFESCDRNISPIDLVPVLPDLYKNQSLTLSGFGLPLEDMVRAGEMVKQMGGKIEIYSNSVGAAVVKIRIPLVQGESLN